MDTKSPFAALEAARDILGSESALAAAIGLKQQSVNRVFRDRGQAPAGWCLGIERATQGKVTRQQLRPDLYPVEEIAESATPQARSA